MRWRNMDWLNPSHQVLKKREMKWEKWERWKEIEMKWNWDFDEKERWYEIREIAIILHDFYFSDYLSSFDKKQTSHKKF